MDMDYEIDFDFDDEVDAGVGWDGFDYEFAMDELLEDFARDAERAETPEEIAEVFEFLGSFDVDVANAREIDDRFDRAYLRLGVTRRARAVCLRRPVRSTRTRHRGRRCRPAARRTTSRAGAESGDSGGGDSDPAQVAVGFGGLR